MKSKVICLVVLLILAYAAVVLADTPLKAEVDKLNMTTAEDLTYKLTVTSSAKTIARPKFPEFKGFTILSNAQTSEIAVFGRARKSSVVYVFILAPLKTGKVEIEPSQVKVEGKNYSSEAFEIEVKPSLSPPTAPEPEEPRFTL